MSVKLNRLIEEGFLSGKRLLLFGHCNASEELADLLMSKGYMVDAILDNNSSKYELQYKDIPIKSPSSILSYDTKNFVVLIVTRFYEAMNRQLMELAFEGIVYKLVDYNSYAEYSLSEDTINRKKKRLEKGIRILDELGRKYPGAFRIFCPYSSLGDVYYCMCYLPDFFKCRNITNAVICVYTRSCRDVVSIFGEYNIELLSQDELDSAVQATIFLKDEYGFIAHNDKPYVMNLTKALYIKKLSFDIIYRCGVFGLPINSKSAIPVSWDEFPNLGLIPDSKSVILAPYAGSVVSLGKDMWLEIRDTYTSKGYEVFTNTSPGEEPIEGTKAICPKIREMKSVVEKAGVFIGLRSGICDVIRSANCRKIALYPDYNFSDTKWKSIDVFQLEEFENIVIKDGTEWKTIL